MKYTLLEIVQRILSSMDSDEVNSINDTTEALQVAYVVQQVYNDITVGTDFPEQYEVFELLASQTISSPIIMTLPPDVRSIKWIRYNSYLADSTTPLWIELTPLSFEEMLDRSFALDPTATNVAQCNINTPDGAVKHVYGWNDRHPLHYAEINSDTLIFDSYLAAVDSTLQKSKSMACGRVEKDFTLSDDFVALLDEKQFSILLNEAKALCFAELKQASHAKAEKQARKAWINYARTRDNIRGSKPTLPNYGRNPGTFTTLTRGRNTNW